MTTDTVYDDYFKGIPDDNIIIYDDKENIITITKLNSNNLRKVVGLVEFPQCSIVRDKKGFWEISYIVTKEQKNYFLWRGKDDQLDPPPMLA